MKKGYSWPKYRMAKKGANQAYHADAGTTVVPSNAAIQLRALRFSLENDHDSFQFNVLHPISNEMMSITIKNSSVLIGTFQYIIHGWEALQIENRICEITDATKAWYHQHASLSLSEMAAAYHEVLYQYYYFYICIIILP